LDLDWLIIYVCTVYYIYIYMNCTHHYSIFIYIYIYDLYTALNSSRLKKKKRVFPAYAAMMAGRRTQEFFTSCSIFFLKKKHWSKARFLRRNRKKKLNNKPFYGFNVVQYGSMWTPILYRKLFCPVDIFCIDRWDITTILIMGVVCTATCCYVPWFILFWLHFCAIETQDCCVFIWQ